MDEGGGDFSQGRLAPGSYDLSGALLSFCWAPAEPFITEAAVTGLGAEAEQCAVYRGWQDWTPLPERHSARAQSPLEL